MNMTLIEKGFLLKCLATLLLHELMMHLFVMHFKAMFSYRQNPEFSTM
jgi:hypothetical protein